MRDEAGMVFFDEFSLSFHMHFYRWGGGLLQVGGGRCRWGPLTEGACSSSRTGRTPPRCAPPARPAPSHLPRLLKWTVALPFAFAALGLLLWSPEGGEHAAPEIPLFAR